MNQIAKGTFEVSIKPQTLADAVVAANLGRMTIEKVFSGDLEGTSMGEMLAVQGGVKGSAGYVAMERVVGVLGGKRGTFVLQHHGIMNRGAPSLVVTVVPDSGTEELAGITGELAINIVVKKHFYEFRYEVA